MLLVGGRKGIRPVKNWVVGCWHGYLPGQGADLHMAQLMPLPLTISCSSKSKLVLPYWYRLTRVVPDKGPLNGCLFFVNLLIYYFTPLRLRCIVINLFVCASACFSVFVHLHNSKTVWPNFTTFLWTLPMAVVRSSYCDTLCTTGFTDDVMFSYYGTYRQMDGHGIVY